MTPAQNLTQTATSLKIVRVLNAPRELSDAPGGKTQLTLVHEKLPNTDSVKEHTMGWQGCLENLAKLF